MYVEYHTLFTSYCVTQMPQHFTKFITKTFTILQNIMNHFTALNNYFNDTTHLLTL